MSRVSIRKPPALGRSPEVRHAEAEVEGIRGKQLQARGLGYPQVELTGVVGPSPRARGDQVHSPDDQYAPDITGAFLRGSVGILQPLFTWGLIDNARRAAEHGLRATQAGVDAKSTEVALRVKEAYWGAVAARSIQAFLLEVQAQIDGAVQRRASRGRVDEERPLEVVQRCRERANGRAR